MKNKTIAAWLALLGGGLGLHRFYLFGWRDPLGFALWLPTGLGVWGLLRVRDLGLDDPLSWGLLPLCGFSLACCAFMAILYGLQTPEKWNARFNPQAPLDAPAGATHWGTIGAIVCALLAGTVVLMSSVVYSAQRYFESQVEAAREISQ
jgi:hypothetical protein